MLPYSGADGISNGYREVSYQRQRMQTEYPQPSHYGGAGGDYQQGTLSGSTGGGPANAFPVLRLRGLPFKCRESDVYDFFEGIDIVDVLLVKKQGRFSGDAFVVFTMPQQADLALQKDRQYMRHRYIEVFRSQKPEYYRAIADEISWEDQPTRRRDPSTDSSQHKSTRRRDPSTDSSQHKSTRRRHRSTDSSQHKSTRRRHRSTDSSLKDNNDNSEHQDDRNNDKDDVEHTGVLKMRGLPFSVSKKDIIDFFSDYKLSEESVHILDQTGSAFVEFESAEDSKAAMSKDNMMIGSKYVELLPLDKE